jgi:hypothetical protein
MAGVTSDTFAPTQDLKRAAAAVVLVRAFGWHTDTTGGPHFSDVPTTNWAYAYVETLYNKGISSGCAAGKYCPDDAASRAQFVTLLVRGLNLPLVTPSTPTFVDVPKTHFAYSYIETAVAKGIAAGYDQTHFKPDIAIKRDQTAVMIYRALSQPPVETT